MTKNNFILRQQKLSRALEEAGKPEKSLGFENLIGKASGLYVERKLIANKTLEDKTEEELEAELKRIEDNFGIRREDETE